MSLFNRTTKTVVAVSKIELFMNDIEAFEAWAFLGEVANKIVIDAIKDAEMNKVYITLAGLQKKYNAVTNDSAYDCKWAR